MSISAPFHMPILSIPDTSSFPLLVTPVEDGKWGCEVYFAELIEIWSRNWSWKMKSVINKWEVSKKKKNSYPSKPCLKALLDPTVLLLYRANCWKRHYVKKSEQRNLQRPFTKNKKGKNNLLTRAFRIMTQNFDKQFSNFFAAATNSNCLWTRLAKFSTA